MQSKEGYGKEERKNRWTTAKPARTWLGCLEGLGVFLRLCLGRFRGHCTTASIPMQVCCCVWRNKLLWKLSFLPGGKHVCGCHLWTLFSVYLTHPVFPLLPVWELNHAGELSSQPFFSHSWVLKKKKKKRKPMKGDFFFRLP